MKFHVIANKTYRVELTVEREYEVDVTKKAVVEAGLCANVVDGDPTAWYNYVEDYLREEGLENFMADGKVNCDSHEEGVAVTKILKQHIDQAIENSVDFVETNCVIENVEWN